MKSKKKCKESAKHLANVGRGHIEGAYSRFHFMSCMLTVALTLQ